MTVIRKLVYPAALTAFGVGGNAYILGNQIRGIKDDLRSLIKEMKADLGDMKHDIRRLTARQTEMELHDISIAVKLLKNCGKNNRNVE